MNLRYQSLPLFLPYTYLPYTYLPYAHFSLNPFLSSPISLFVYFSLNPFLSSLVSLFAYFSFRLFLFTPIVLRSLTDFSVLPYTRISSSSVYFLHLLIVCLYTYYVCTSFFGLYSFSIKRLSISKVVCQGCALSSFTALYFCVFSSFSNHQPKNHIVLW